MKNAMKQVLILVLCAVMVLTLCACKSKQAKAVDEQILAIGEVTADSGNAITAAEEAYDALSDKDRAEVENYAVLTAAREQYAVCVVQDLEDFVAENPYPTDQSSNADGSIIDMELVNAYDQKLTEYTAHGGTADATDAYAYAEKVVSLKQYEPKLEFLRCYYSTNDILSGAIVSMSAATNAWQSGNYDLAVTYFKGTASSFQASHDAAAAFDQDEELVAEYTECLQLLSDGSAMMAAGIDQLSSSKLSDGSDMIVENLELYKTYLEEEQAMRDEIRAIESSLLD